MNTETIRDVLCGMVWMIALLSMLGTDDERNILKRGFLLVAVTILLFT